MTKQITITDQSKALFLAYARDGGNWSGTPLLGEGSNVDSSKEARGNLTQLKRAGLVTTFRYEGCMWVKPTDAGKAFAVELGAVWTD
jgi:hypothetical protein